MKLLETALIAPTPAIAKSILNQMPFRSDIVLGIPAYRFELDPEIGVIFYDLVAARHLPDELLEHLSGHLHSMILLSDSQLTQIAPEVQAKMEAIVEKLGGVRTVSAVLTQPGRLKYLAPPLQDGLFLSDHGRIFFWHPNAPESQLRIWEHVWGITAVAAADDVKT